MNTLFENIFNSSHPFKIINISDLIRKDLRDKTVIINIVIKQDGYYLIKVKVDLDVNENTYTYTPIPESIEILKDKVIKFPKSELDYVARYNYSPKKFKIAKYNEEWTNEIKNSIKNIFYIHDPVKVGNSSNSYSSDTLDTENNNNDDFIFGSPMGHNLMNLILNILPFQDFQKVMNI